VSSGPLLLGVDIGTSLIKAVLVDSAGRELAVGEAQTPWRACPSGAEGDAEELFSQVLVAIGAVLREGEAVGLAVSPIAAVGVSSLAETLVLLDAGGTPLAPLIAWYDRRGSREAAELEGELGRSFVARTGLAVSVLPSVVKLRWLTRHLPAAGGARLALSLAEWVAHRLGGEPAAELSLASRTGALDVSTGRWWDGAVAWAGWERSPFPPAVPAGTVLGHVTSAPDGLAALAGAAITVGGHDHLCAAAGAGVLSAGELFDSCGTAEGFLRAVTPLPQAVIVDAVASGLAVSCHVLPGLQALLGGRPFGLVLQAVRDLLGASPAVTAARPGGSHPAAEPALAGEEEGLELRIEPSGRATLSGIVPGVSPLAAWEAAAEAVLEQSFAVYEQLARLGGPVPGVVLTGGWAEVEPMRSAKLARFPTTRRPLLRQAGGRGAALFAGCAAGVFASPAEFPPPAYEVLEPA